MAIDIWKDIDRSHRKLGLTAAPGRTGVWMSEATVLRVLRQEHLILPGTRRGNGQPRRLAGLGGVETELDLDPKLPRFQLLLPGRDRGDGRSLPVLADHPGDGWSAR